MEVPLVMNRALLSPTQKLLLLALLSPAVAYGQVQDCNRNGEDDAIEVRYGEVSDCDGNRVPDSCDLESTPGTDCTENGVYDACDLHPALKLNVAGSYNALGRMASAADLDGDGDLDLAVLGDHLVQLTLNNGNGTFVDGARLPSGSTLSEDRHIITAQLVGDSLPDIVVAITGSAWGLALQENTGGGTFKAPVRLFQRATSGDKAMVEVAAVDLNRDGALDLVAIGSEGLYSLINKRDGTFLAPVITPGMIERFPVGGAIAVGDFNRDGWSDVAVPSILRDVTLLYLNLGDGTGRLANVTTAPAIGSSLAVGDFNGDGVADLAGVAPYSARLRVIFGGESGVARGMYYDQPTVAGSGLRTLDLNNDGILDLIGSGNNIQALVVHIGRGDGGFHDAILVPVPGYTLALVPGDYNRDGRPDIVATENWGGHLHALLNKTELPTDVDINGDRVPDSCVTIAGTGGPTLKTATPPRIAAKLDSYGTFTLSAQHAAEEGARCELELTLAAGPDKVLHIVKTFPAKSNIFRAAAKEIIVDRKQIPSFQLELRKRCEGYLEVGSNTASVVVPVQKVTSRRMRPATTGAELASMLRKQLEPLK